MLADILLDPRVDGAVGAHSAGDGTEGDILLCVLQALIVAVELPGPAAELHAESHGFGVDAVGTADAERLLLLEGTPLADLAELLAVIKQDVGCLHELIAERRIAEVGACHAVMDPP